MRVGNHAAIAAVALLVSTLAMPAGQPSDNPANDFAGAKQSRVVTWQVKRVPPPSPLYVDVDDLLVCGAASSQLNEVVTVNFRFQLAATGEIKRGQFTVQPGSNRAVVTNQRQLAEGFLLSASVKAAVATTRGQTFARLFIGAGPFGTGQPAYMLMSDYVTTAMAPAFPNGRQLAPVEGPGWIRQFAAVNPPAGGEFTIAVPTNARWRLQGLEAILATSIAAGNRQPTLRAFGGVAIAFQAVQLTTTGPSATGVYIWAPELTNTGVAALTVGAAPTPDGHILSANNGDTLNSQTAGLDVADQWSQVQTTIEEWLENV